MKLLTAVALAIDPSIDLITAYFNFSASDEREYSMVHGQEGMHEYEGKDEMPTMLDEKIIKEY